MIDGGLNSQRLEFKVHRSYQHNFVGIKNEGVELSLTFIDKIDEKWWDDSAKNDKNGLGNRFVKTDPSFWQNLSREDYLLIVF